MSASRPFAPTLTRALEALQGESRHGFTFVRADGEERWFSFGELVGLGARRAAALRARGVAKGDRVALVVPEGEEFVLSFIGAVMAGAIPVPMYPAVSFRNLHVYHDTVTHIAGAAGAKLMVTTASSREFVAPAAPRIPSLTGLVTVDDLAGDHGSLIEHAQPGDTAFLQFTSGSTSRPKGVVVTHDNLRANTEAFVKEGLAVDIDVDKGVSWLPMFHDMGLIGFVIGPLFGSVDVVFLPTASFVRRPGVWLEALSRHKGTITYAPNFAFQLVAKRVKERDLAELDLSPLRATGSGAEPINAKTLRDFADKLAPAGFDRRSFLASYGMAEATLAISFVPRGAGLTADAVDPKALEQGKASPASAEGGREIVSCGRSFAGHEVAIVDERGARLGEREVGEIVVKGPSVCAGYYGEPEGRDPRRLAPHRRPRLRRGRRDLRLRAAEGPHHHPRPQLLPERHRVGRRRPAGRPPRQRRRVFGRRGRRRAARRLRRGHARRRAEHPRGGRQGRERRLRAQRPRGRRHPARHPPAHVERQAAAAQDEANVRGRSVRRRPRAGRLTERSGRRHRRRVSPYACCPRATCVPQRDTQGTTRWNATPDSSSSRKSPPRWWSAISRRSKKRRRSASSASTRWGCSRSWGRWNGA